MRKLLYLVLAIGPTLCWAQSPEETASNYIPEIAFDKFQAAPKGVKADKAASQRVHSLSAKLLFLDYGIRNVEGNSITSGIEFGYQYRITNRISLAAPMKLGIINQPEQPGTRQPFLGADIIGQYGMPLLDSKLIPYALAGLGFVTEPRNGSNVQVPIGAGLKLRVSSSTFINVQYEHRISTKQDRQNSQVGIGLVFNLGGGQFNPRYWDTDGDGVMDDVDQCVTVAGLSQYKGCPDSDGDGIYDAIDPCPLYASSLAEGGCPDADKDGIPDPLDQCPDEAGDLVYGGCPPPDRDGDGYPDEIDECPELVGTLLGCPDTDADGINDLEDICPKQAGERETGGCPDRDMDGFPDMLDNCPLLAGTLNGCPDRDNDGVDDGADRCPNIAGEARFDGCPEIMSSERNLFEYAVRAIGFEDASAIIDPRGYDNLTGLAEIMIRYPEYKVRITGHCDFEELVPDRTRFSEERAKACVNFLRAKGVDPTRVEVDGIGAGQPIVREGSLEERAINRRVEFDLYVP